VFAAAEAAAEGTLVPGNGGGLQLPAISSRSEWGSFDAAAAAAVLANANQQLQLQTAAVVGPTSALQLGCAAADAGVVGPQGQLLRSASYEVTAALPVMMELEPQQQQHYVAHQQQPQMQVVYDCSCAASLVGPSTAHAIPIQQAAVAGGLFIHPQQQPDAASAAMMRQRRTSYEERNAMRLRAYLEQQHSLTLAPDWGGNPPVVAAMMMMPAGGGACQAAGAAPSMSLQQQPALQMGLPPLMRTGSMRRSSAASYSSHGTNMLLPDLPEPPAAYAYAGGGFNGNLQQQPLGPLGFPQHSRRASAASYCSGSINAAGGLVPGAMMDACMLPPPTTPAGWPSLGGAPASQQRVRRASVASCGSGYYYQGGASSCAGSTGAMLAGAEGVAPNGAPLLSGMTPRSRRASAASCASNHTGPAFYPGGGGASAGALPFFGAAAARSRRASCTSTLSSFSFGGGAGYDGLVSGDVLEEPLLEDGCGAAANAGAAASLGGGGGLLQSMQSQQLQFVCMPEGEPLVAPEIQQQQQQRVMF